MGAKLRKNERNRKEKLKFYFSFGFAELKVPSASNFGEANVMKKTSEIEKKIAKCLGVADMHCLSDEYLAEELILERKKLKHIGDL